jgi:sialate O-acetylesterase
VVISSPNVRNPVAVRYAYTDGAISNLQNKEGLAAFPFRTDSFQSSIAVAVDMPELY